MTKRKIEMAESVFGTVELVLVDFVTESEQRGGPTKLVAKQSHYFKMIKKQEIIIN